MTEVTGRLRWDGEALRFGRYFCGAIVHNQYHDQWEAIDFRVMSTLHPTEQEARDALFARVVAAITEDGP